MKRVGQWRLETVLGQGGMGSVYLGRRSRDGMIAAVKVIRPELASDPMFRARFRREVEACSAVRGPRVAELVDADAVAATPWLAVRYVSGPTLASHVATSGPLSTDVVVAFAVGLADALQVIWSADVVHRDLKPTNVILTSEGPVVIDFGIAIAAEATSMTATGVTVGSAGWIAPEQLRGTAVSELADVWGWGALVSFAASGTGPFGEGRPEALAWRALHQEPEVAVLDQVPTSLRGPVERALAPDPESRPAPELLPALAAGQSVEEPAQIPATRVERDTLVARLWDLPGREPDTTRQSGPLRRRWGVVGAGLAAGVLAASGLAVVAWPSGDGQSGNGNGEGAAGTAPEAADVPPSSTTAASTTVPETSTSVPATTTTAPSAVETTDFANHSYQLDCGPGSTTYQLVDGVAGDGADFGEHVELSGVYRYDFDGDRSQDAVVEVGCASGASLTVTALFPYTDVDGELVRVGEPFVIQRSLLRRTGDTTFETFQPVSLPDEPLCCPSTFERAYWTIDFNSHEVFVSAQPSETIPADQLPQFTQSGF